MTANASGDFIPFVLADPAKQACDDALQTFMTQLKPQLKSVTDDERATQPRISAEVDDFCDKGLAYGYSNPELLPAGVRMDEYQNDTDAVVILTTYVQGMQQLVDMMKDTISRARVGRYGRARAYYKNTQIGAEMNMPGAATIRDDMGVAFAKFGRRKAVTSPAPAPAPDKE